MHDKAAEAPESVPPLTAMPERPISGAGPDPLEVRITMASYFELIAFRDWVASGEMGRRLWAWMGANGYHV